MKLIGKIIKGTKIIKQVKIEKSEEMVFRDALEEALVEVCRELDIQVPIWLKKNTTELALYRFTFFSGEQFLESVSFDKFEIRLE
ncbi:MAG: hypothetical protein Q8920_17255 [Bacillota bacterium]|nr:hypothetical protein [Bacillota bacterium]